ncbi:MAG: nucleotidyltransferase family protein [Candidatus Binatia bacterium]
MPHFAQLPRNIVLQTKEEIVAALLERQEQIQALGVKRLNLFGSFVREQQTSQSDVDLLVEFEQGQKTFDHFMQLAFLLEEILQQESQS